MKKYDLIYYEEDGSWHFCIKVLPVYTLDLNIHSKKLTFDLLNLVYVPSKDEFGFNHQKWLSKKLAEKYQNQDFSHEKADELQSLGYVKYSTIIELVNDYNELSSHMAYKKYYNKKNNINDSTVDELKKELESLKESIFQAYGIIGDVIEVKDVKEENASNNELMLEVNDDKTYKFKP